MEMRDYYAARLSAGRLQKCYALASPRVRRYLEAEIRFVRDPLRPADRVLELGCGYGRVTVRLAEMAERVVGIDRSSASVALAVSFASTHATRGHRCGFAVMDAVALGFVDGAFDRVVCVQNGICAFGVDPERLAREALRVTRPGGTVMFSSYAEEFWSERVGWFEAQAEAGLVGPIDRERTRDGVITCTDGFRSGTFTPAAFRSLGVRLALEPRITPVDGSSVCCEFTAPGGG